MARIRLESPFAERIGGTGAVEVPAPTVESALRGLTDRYPQLVRLIWISSDVVNPLLAVFLNDKLLEPHELGAAVEPDDKIDIIAAVAGG
jgi:molybdopterin converting factor small subunit